MFSDLIDVKENNLLLVDYELLGILLYDNSSKKNIIWATDNYSHLGHGYHFSDNITINKITGTNGLVIRPRVKKTAPERNRRIRDKAEVFTPSWICNQQNNIVDETWFQSKNVFNFEDNENWITNKNNIVFPEGKNWCDYIELLRLEVSCGEAPYLVSRYDTVTGNSINIKERIGLLDRKFRVLNENVIEEKEWIDWSIKAMKSIYGYDWQGDNVLLARENLLYTYIDNYRHKFNKKPSLNLIKQIATIISWNIWQMDGIKAVIPNSCQNEKIIDHALFDEGPQKVECLGCKKNTIGNHNGIYCQIMNWQTNEPNKYVLLLQDSAKNIKK